MVKSQKKTTKPSQKKSNQDRANEEAKKAIEALNKRLASEKE
jgi:hypothetical protein